MTSPPSERIIIADTGDVIFTLQSPGAPFAVWDQAPEENSEIQDPEAEHEDKPSNDATSDARADDPNQHVPRQATLPDVVYQVSSQHLICASPKFKSELISWSESLKWDDGLYHAHTTDWDPEAFGILLNVLHLRFRQVPKSLSLELLAKMAILVDYYRCWESFDLIADVWITHLRAKCSVPETYGRDLMLWILISWVFKLEDEFAVSTFRALVKSDEPILRNMELSIPPAILQAIETRRSELIQGVIGVCQGWFDKFCSGYWCIRDEKCSFECGSMLLGALTRQMNNMAILSPRPAAPYAGLSVTGLRYGIKSIKAPDLHIRYERRSRSPEYRKHPCSLDPVISEVNQLYNRAYGFRLHEFVDRAESAIDVSFRQS
ncbi:unnamed protein product [Alternaria alternata]